jgi:hypothetical protein
MPTKSYSYISLSFKALNRQSRITRVAVPLPTAFIRFCLLYAPLGISTSGKAAAAVVAGNVAEPKWLRL